MEDTAQVPDGLADFFRTNPESSLEETDENYLVKKPWGDDTVSIRIKKNDGSLLASLNAVRLPTRFSAVWHLGNNDLEFIFGPLKLDNPLNQRKFTFHYEGRSFQCEFGESSQALTLIGNACRPTGPSSDTRHRNIPAIQAIRRIQKAETHQGKESSFSLNSFYVRQLQLPEERLPELASHLNFYMSFFDRRSPLIVIHEERDEDAYVDKNEEEPNCKFPDAIVGRKLDPYLLVLWETGYSSGDPVRQVLSSYQILEYASFYYLKEEVVHSVRRLIGCPDILGRVDYVSREILDLVAEDRMSDEAKIVAVVNQVVDPSKVWEEIEARSRFFSTPTEFDGGYTQPALIKEGWKLDDFQSAWSPKVPDALRKLRNALVHAREQRLSRCIAPTKRNQHLLRPWAALAISVGYQVLLHSSTT